MVDGKYNYILLDYYILRKQHTFSWNIPQKEALAKILETHVRTNFGILNMRYFTLTGWSAEQNTLHHRHI